MSDLRHRGGAIDPEGDDFAAEFDREFGTAEPRATTVTEPLPPSPDEDELEAGSPAGDGGGRGGDDAPPPAVDGGGPSLPARVGMRIIRRPYEWFRRPWPDDRVVRLAVTVSTLVVTTFIMMRVVHFRPILGDDLIFKN